MKDIREVYPEALKEGDYFWTPSDYQPLLDSLGHEILVQNSAGSYQGDVYLLLRNAEGKFGYLRFGWGSCSGCDALQGCDSYEEISALRDSLAGAIQWFDNSDAARDFFVSRDWETEFLDDDGHDFVRRAKERIEAS